jgi:uncharacterized SAM-binding protein YcdF (DUF218 family)
MIWRVLSALLLLWVFGFALFVVLLPGPADNQETDAIIVLTGGENRLSRGIVLLQEGRATRMLVSGVNRSVRPVELAVETNTPESLFTCCIDLGREAVDTQGNGDEAAAWVRANRFQTIRLVTTDWHMPRARFELARAMDDGVELLADAVPSDPSFMQLFVEYNKYLARRIIAVFGA